MENTYKGNGYKGLTTDDPNDRDEVIQGKVGMTGAYDYQNYGGMLEQREMQIQEEMKEAEKKSDIELFYKNYQGSMDKREALQIFIDEYEEVKSGKRESSFELISDLDNGIFMYVDSNRSVTR